MTCKTILLPRCPRCDNHGEADAGVLAIMLSSLVVQGRAL